jgi:hypothetical protein
MARTSGKRRADSKARNRSKQTSVKKNALHGRIRDPAIHRAESRSISPRSDQIFSEIEEESATLDPEREGN